MDARECGGKLLGRHRFPTISSDWNQPSHSFAVKLATTLSSTSVNEFQFSRAGNDIKISTNAAGVALNNDIASKFPTVFRRRQGWACQPTGVRMDIWHQAPWQNHEDLFIWKDDFSKVNGSHETKFGALIVTTLRTSRVMAPPEGTLLPLLLVAAPRQRIAPRICWTEI